MFFPIDIHTCAICILPKQARFLLELNQHRKPELAMTTNSSVSGSPSSFISTDQHLPHRHHHDHLKRVSEIFHLPHVISSRRSSNASKTSAQYVSTSLNNSVSTAGSPHSYINPKIENSSSPLVSETLKFDHIQRRGRKPPPLTISSPSHGSDHVNLPAPSINNVEFNNIRGSLSKAPVSAQRHRLSITGGSQKQGIFQSSSVSKQHHGTLYTRLRGKTQNALHIRDDSSSFSTEKSNGDNVSGNSSYNSAVAEPFITSSSSSSIRQEPMRKITGSKNLSSSTHFGSLLTRTASKFLRQATTLDSDKKPIFKMKLNDSSTTLGKKDHSDTTALHNVQKLKSYDGLAIQTSLLPSVSKDSKLPLARTSKEVERIAAYRLNNGSSDTLPGKVQAATQPAKNWMKAHSHRYLLRSRKDSLKSSSNSNSKITGRGQTETRYSFRPSAANNTFSANDLQSVLKELEELGSTDLTGRGTNSGGYDAFSDDRDAVADESWTIFCLLVNPIFKGDRLKAPMEEINKLVFLYLKLRSKKNAKGANNGAQWNIGDTASVIQSTSMDADPSNNRLSSSPYTPITVPSPAFGFLSNLPSPIEGDDASLATCINGSRRVYEEVQDFLRVGMTTTLSLLYYDRSRKSIKIRSPAKSDANNSRSFVNFTDSSFSSYLSDDNFEKSCLLLWDLFYSRIFFYLQGVLLPLDQDEVGSPPMGDYDDQSDRSISGKDEIMSDMILAAFRDQIIIPLYQVNRQVETENERKREHDGALGAMVSKVNFRETRIGGTSEDPDESVNTIKVNANKPIVQSGTNKKEKEDNTEAKYLQGTALLRCFTILNGVQTHDTNQKIIENLMQQMRERCLIHKSTINNEQDRNDKDDQD